MLLSSPTENGLAAVQSYYERTCYYEVLQWTDVLLSSPVVDERTAADATADAEQSCCGWTRCCVVLQWMDVLLCSSAVGGRAAAAEQSCCGWMCYCAVLK